jgi:hypothetical protein
MHAGHNTRWNDPTDTGRCQHAGHSRRGPSSAIRTTAAADTAFAVRVALLARNRCFFDRFRSSSVQPGEQYAGIGVDASPARVAGTGAVNHAPHCGRRHRPATNTLTRRRGVTGLPQPSEQNLVTPGGGHDARGLSSRRIACSIGLQIVNGVPHRTQRQATNIFGPRRPGTNRALSTAGSQARHTCTAEPLAVTASASGGRRWLP